VGWRGVTGYIPSYLLDILLSLEKPLCFVLPLVPIDILELDPSATNACKLPNPNGKGEGDNCNSDGEIV